MPLASHTGHDSLKNLNQQENDAVTFSMKSENIMQLYNGRFQALIANENHSFRNQKLTQNDL
jgi:hypothetical protein